MFSYVFCSIKMLSTHKSTFTKAVPEIAPNYLTSFQDKNKIDRNVPILEDKTRFKWNTERNKLDQIDRIRLYRINPGTYLRTVAAQLGVIAKSSQSKIYWFSLVVSVWWSQILFVPYVFTRVRVSTGEICSYASGAKLDNFITGLIVPFSVLKNKCRHKDRYVIISTGGIVASKSNFWICREYKSGSYKKIRFPLKKNMFAILRAIKRWD